MLPQHRSRQMFRSHSRSLLTTIVALLLPGIGAAVTLEPPKFHWGDSWTYTIATTTQGAVEAPSRMEYGVLWSVAGGSILTGARLPGTPAWNPLEKISPTACLPFIGYPLFSLDDGFCKAAIEAGGKFETTTSYGSRITRFDGMSPLKTKIGTFEAAGFLVVDTLAPGTAEKPSLAHEVRAELWYVPALRGFARLHLRAFDRSGALLQDKVLELDSVALKP